jgi:hypothetical protein
MVAIDRKTDKPIEGVISKCQFFDQNNKDKKSTGECVTDNNGKCIINTIATKSFFTTVRQKYNCTAEANGYSKFVTANLKEVGDSMVLTFGMQKGADSKFKADDLFDKILVRDGELDVNVRLTIEELYKGRYDTAYIRVFINKKTNKVLRQIVYANKYRDDGWRTYNAASGASPDGPVDLNVLKISSDVSCQNKVLDRCLYEEVVGIEMAEELISKITSTYNSESEQYWKFKIESKSDRQEIIEIPLAAFVALEKKISQYK